jgi:hypothetical protein
MYSSRSDYRTRLAVRASRARVWRDRCTQRGLRQRARGTHRRRRVRGVQRHAPELDGLA